MSSAALLPVYPRLPLELVAAAGCWLQTADGRRILDLYGGHAVSPLGHGHPELVATICDAYRTLDFYSNSLHIAAQQQAAAALLGDSEHLRYVHFTNSGTEANESALHLARRITGRSRVLSFECSFHGRTLASLAATGLPGYRRRLSLAAVSEHSGFVRFGSFDDLAQIDGEVAAVLCESVPSLAGIYMPPDDYYPALARRCREVGALLVFDEVQGGIGRLGYWFAHERFGVRPDMVTLAKGIAGGYPAGALLCSSAVGEQVQTGELGTTFGGGPVACRMMSTVARLVRDDKLLQRVRHIFGRVDQALASLRGVEVRGAGCLIGIETPHAADDLRDRLLERDVLVGTSAHPRTIRLLPPYVLTDEAIDRFASALGEAIEDA